MMVGTFLSMYCAPSCICFPG